MDEKTPPPEELNLPRAHFHIALGLLVIPFGSWVLAIMDVLRGYANRAELVWTRLLVALAAVDALVLAALLWTGAHQEELQAKVPADVNRGMIGVNFESARSLRILEVAEGLPGARAGLQAGDRIERVDGKSVTTAKEFADALQTAGVARSLTFQRGEQSMTVSITPERIPRLGEEGLFKIEPSPGSPLDDDSLLEMLPALAVVGILALAGRWRRSPGMPVWAGFLVALLGMAVSVLGFEALLKRSLGGVSLGVMLISILVQDGALLAFTLASRRWLTQKLPPETPTMTPFRAGLQGFFYLLTGVPRLLVVLGAASRILFPDSPVGDPVAMRLAEARFGPLGGVLLAAGIAGVVPIAEEFLFRGYLLPRLVFRWGEIPGLAATSLIFALLHLRDGPFVLLMFLCGWVFGWARLRSGSVAPSMVLHMLYNAVGVTVILLQP
jgi:membrane protease YdiL (CAAX protease family)